MPPGGSSGSRTGGGTGAERARAIRTGSLNLLTIEGDELVYVRTGKAVARIDRETNCIVDDETGLIVAFIDADGSIVPIVPENAE